MRPKDRLGADLPGAGEPPEVYAVRREASGWRLRRRDLVSAAAAAAGALPRGGSAQTVCPGVVAHAGSVSALAFSPDGQTLISGSEDKTLKYWLVPAGAYYGAVQQPGRVTCLAFTPDGRMLAVVYQSGVALLSWPARELIRNLECLADSVAISRDGRLLAAGARYGGVTLWSLPEGRLLKKLAVSSNGLAFSADGDLLVTVNSDDTDIRVWSVPQGIQVRSWFGHTMGAWEAEVDPEGRLLATTGFSNTIKLWSLPEGRLLRMMGEFSMSISQLRITPDGRLLVTIGSDNNLRLFSLPDGAPVNTIAAHTGRARSVAVSPDGRMLATGGDDKTIRLWSLPDGQLLNACLLDLALVSRDVQGVLYSQGGVLYTLRCGAPLPPGVVCICNCVQGGACTCVSHVCACVGYTCACVGHVCSCVSVSHYWYPN